ncbi:hypothetical protein KUTeg_008610 [Tegillarca granosa]|uniref:Dermatopontin n=1 Tax=Tegillarca granosa TaxID=220873 RepID=A0ABQ9F9K6_TEGGR|nr:hypothetical protein KUTeg_008610 [Tegillarca granosa]
MSSLIKLLALVCIWELAYCWKNQFDKPFTYTCPRNQVITRIRSVHNNAYEDRLYDYSCSKRGNEPNLCSWTGYINNFDQRINFVCPFDGVIAGFHSYHSNYHEDRRWKVYCLQKSCE